MREQEIFEAALERNGELRSQYLDSACGTDSELRQRVQKLLKLHDEAGEFFEKPAAEIVATIDKPTIDKPTIDKPTIDRPTIDQPVTEKPGTQIGPYKLLQQIGEGGMGVVYMAEQEKPVSRKVALKIIKHGMDTKQVIARFEAERQALALMAHPNIAGVLDAGSTQAGRPYFVMELVKGVSITDFCDKNRLDAESRINLFLNVCHAVQHAHQKGIIHRDIKPSNVMVTLHDGVPIVKVIDFGLAKATTQKLTEKTLFTSYGQLVGTPTYMSPEQAEMSGLDVDTRTDVYSLGVLLYELLTGVTPLDAVELRTAGYAEMQKLICEREPMRPSTRLSSMGDGSTFVANNRASDPKRLSQRLRGDLDVIVMKCLQKDRNQRYETANGLAKDLMRHLADEPVVARPPSATYMMQKLWRRHRLAISTTLAIVGALMLATVVSVWQTKLATDALSEAKIANAKAATALTQVEDERDRARRAEYQATQSGNDARRNLYSADMKATQVYIDDGNLGAANALLERYRSEFTNANPPPWEWRHLFERAKGDPHRKLRGHTATVKDVGFSPNGRFLASQSDNELLVWDREKGFEYQEIEVSEPIAGFGFTYDSQFLGVMTEGGKLSLLDPTTKKIHKHILENEQIQLSGRLQFSPTTPHVAVTSERVLQWVNYETEEREEPFEGKPCNIFGISDDGTHLWCLRQNEVLIWELAKRRVVKRLNLGQDEISTVSLTNGTEGFLFSKALAAPLVRATSSSKWMQLPGAKSGINRYVVDQERGTLVGSGFDHFVYIWRLDDLKFARRLSGHRDEVWCVAISQKGEIVTGGQDHNVILWETSFQTATGATAELPFAFDAKQQNLAAFADEHRWSARGTLENDVIIHDYGANEVVERIPDAGIPLCFKDQDRRLVTLLGGKAISWRLGTKLDSKSTAEQIGFFDLGFQEAAPGFYHHYSVVGDLLSINDDQGNTQVVNFYEGNRILTIDHGPASSAISADGKYVAVATPQRRVEVWDIQQSAKVADIISEHTRPLSPAWSPDGTLLATSSIDSIARIWKVGTWDLVHTLRGHRRGIFAARFTPDGQTFVTACNDHSIRFWNMHTGREVVSSEVDWIPWELHFSPDQTLLPFGGAFSSPDQVGKMKAFRAPPWEEIRDGQR